MFRTTVPSLNWSQSLKEEHLYYALPFNHCLFDKRSHKNQYGIEMYQKQLSEAFHKKNVPRIFTKFTGKHLCKSLFFNKVADLRPETLLKKRLWQRYFPVNFEKFLRTPFLTEHLSVIASDVFRTLLNVYDGIFLEKFPSDMFGRVLNTSMQQIGRSLWTPFSADWELKLPREPFIIQQDSAQYLVTNHSPSIRKYLVNQQQRKLHSKQ